MHSEPEHHQIKVSRYKLRPMAIGVMKLKSEPNANEKLMTTFAKQDLKVCLGLTSPARVLKAFRAFSRVSNVL